MLPRRWVMTINCVLLVMRRRYAAKRSTVDVVQGGLDLIQHAERRRTDLHNGKIQRNGHQCLFATGKQFQMGDDLARRLDRNLDARMENILRVGQGEVCRPTPKQFLKGL